MKIERKCGFSMSLSPSLQVTQRLSLATIQMAMFTMRLQLIGALRGESFHPRGVCPKCGRSLTSAEIIRGFNSDPNDYTTGCTKCGHRFEPQLICITPSAKVEVPFYCPSQVLAQLDGLETFSPERLAREYPAVFRSAVVHYGGIKAAFQRISKEYSFEEYSEWKDIVQQFLGHLPDTVIAQCVGVKARTIRSIRLQKGIPACRVRQMVEEAESIPAE